MTINWFNWLIGRQYFINCDLRTIRAAPNVKCRYRITLIKHGWRKAIQLTDSVCDLIFQIVFYFSCVRLSIFKNRRRSSCSVRAWPEPHFFAHVRYNQHPYSYLVRLRRFGIVSGTTGWFDGRSCLFVSCARKIKHSHKRKKKIDFFIAGLVLNEFTAHSHINYTVHDTCLPECAIQHGDFVRK